LRIESGDLRISNVEIFDVFGRNVGVNTQVRTENLEKEILLNISHLSVGVYFVKINTEVGEVIKKVLKE
jgi:phage host-nuclease inhibitor protein Gam